MKYNDLNTQILHFRALGRVTEVDSDDYQSLSVHRAYRNPNVNEHSLRSDGLCSFLPALLGLEKRRLFSLTSKAQVSFRHSTILLLSGSR